MFLAEIDYNGELSGQAYIVLTCMLTIIVGGLGWCFYRAIGAASKDSEEQLPDEV